MAIVVALTIVDKTYELRENQKFAKLFVCLQQEAVRFSLDWKVPCVVVYKKRSDVSSTTKTEDDTVTNPITIESLLRNKSLIETPRRRSMTFTPLGDDELPASGAVVGLDAEFVTLNQVRLR